MRSETQAIRVGFVLYEDDLNAGGSLRLAQLLANNFDPAQVEAHLIFAYGHRGPVGKRTHVPCHYLGARNSKDVRAWRKARTYLRRLNPEILHFHHPVYWLQAALAGTGVKKLMHVHGPLTTSLIDRLARRVTRDWAAAHVCINGDLARELLARRWAIRSRTFTLYNGIDCAMFRNLPHRRAARRDLGLPEDKLLLGMVCRLASYKGCLEAVRLLAQLDQRWDLVFLGDGPMRASILALAAKLGLADRVHLVGMLDDVRPGYAAMDAMLFLSRREPFGLVIAEAMSSLVPVFGLTDGGGYQDPDYPLVVDDNAVFLTRGETEEELAESLRSLALRISTFGNDPLAYAPMVSNAERWVRQRFDIDQPVNALTELYRSLLGRSGDCVGADSGTAVGLASS